MIKTDATGMLFGMKAMDGDKEDKSCSSCGHAHAKTEHIESGKE